MIPSSVPELATVVREEMNRITAECYRTTRRGGHSKDNDESLTDRSFWPGVNFSPIEIRADEQMALTFSTTDLTDRTFGYRFDLAIAVERWNLRIGIVDAMSRPLLFASELCWYMVAQIGSVDLDGLKEGDDGISWIDARTTIFGRLIKPQVH